MRQDVEFKTLDGVVLRGWFYPPSPPAEGFPVVVMSHGFSAVKEMYLDSYAEVFSRAGLGVLVYDNRGLGASGGEPRQQIDRVLQIRDYSDAITFAQTLPGADPERIGIWGSSFSGGNVLVVAATDRRVKCVVSQVPATHRIETLRMAAGRQDHFTEERRRLQAGQAPTMVPVVSADPTTACVLSTADSLAWFTETAKSRAPAWRNEVTRLSLDLGRLVHPGDYAPFIAPTPLLMIVAEDDALTPAPSAVEAFDRAVQPKRLVMLPGGHFDPYVSRFPQSSAAARDWFVQHLDVTKSLSVPRSRTVSADRPVLDRRPDMSRADRGL